MAKMRGRKALEKAVLSSGRDGRPAVLVTEDHRVDKSRAARIQRQEEVLNAMSPKRRSKYHNNVRSTEDGKFDSDAEYRRWVILKIRQQTGEIFGLKRQVRFPLSTVTPIGRELVRTKKADSVYHTHWQKVGDYVADFVYNLPDGTQVVEDVKGQRTDVFKWKARHFKIEYGFSISEVKA